MLVIKVRPRRNMLVTSQPVIGHQVQQFITVVQAARGRPVAGVRVHHRALCVWPCLQGPRQPAPADACAHFMVDVERVRSTTIDTTSAPSSWNTMGAIWYAAPCAASTTISSLEREVIGERALAELYVAPGRVLETPCLSQRGESAQTAPLPEPAPPQVPRVGATWRPGH